MVVDCWWNMISHLCYFVLHYAVTIWQLWICTTLLVRSALHIPKLPEDSLIILKKKIRRSPSQNLRPTKPKKARVVCAWLTSLNMWPAGRPTKSNRALSLRHRWLYVFLIVQRERSLWLVFSPPFMDRLRFTLIWFRLILMFCLHICITRESRRLYTINIYS